MMPQCSRCFGRGFLAETRKPSKRNPNGLGFYARNCPRCGGVGYVSQDDVEREQEAIRGESRADNDR